MQLDGKLEQQVECERKKRWKNTKYRTKNTLFRLLPCKLLSLYAVAVADIALQ